MNNLRAEPWPPPSMRNACIEVEVEEDDLVLDAVIIWAFCLMTSAGVRTRHEASSAVPEAREWTMGCGRAEERVFA